MPTREYTCAECGGTFIYECRGRPRVYCEDCAPIRKRRKIREWEQARTPEQRRATYERNRDSVIERATAWNRANPERRSQILRRYYAAHRDSIAETIAAWRAANLDKVYAYSLLGNARRRGANVADSATRDYAAIVRYDPCSYCENPTPRESDHIDAVSKGGANHWTNLTACCRSCNPSKSNLPLLIYLLRRG